MSRKQIAAELVHRQEGLLECPLCKSEMEVRELKSVVCTNNHTFDFAKQGYINLLNQSGKSNYDKGLFSARHQIIMASELYEPLHQQILNLLKEKSSRPQQTVILDAGSGEGSHLARLLDKCESERFIGLGIDISKEGVRQAASKYSNEIWLVADLANIPLRDQSIQVILNILSPANYEEFKRVLALDGLMIKVVPGSNYLVELREGLYQSEEKKTYTNEETVALFKEHFCSVRIENVRYRKQLNQSELINLVKMSPLSWNAGEDALTKLYDKEHFEITVDVDVLIGEKPQ